MNFFVFLLRFDLIKKSADWNARNYDETAVLSFFLTIDVKVFNHRYLELVDVNQVEALSYLQVRIHDIGFKAELYALEN